MSSNTPTKARILRLPQVIARTGYGKTWIYTLMKRGEFPQAKKIGSNSVGWSSIEIQQWIDSKLDDKSAA